MVGDSLLACLLACFDVLIFIAQARAGESRRGAAAVVRDAAGRSRGVVAPLVFRRKYPITAAYLTLLASASRTPRWSSASRA